MALRTGFMARLAACVTDETMRANQLRLYFSSFACVLLTTLRHSALAGTELQEATCATLRLRLLKIGAQVRAGVRRLWVRLSSAYPLAVLFHKLWERLRAPPSLAPA